MLAATADLATTTGLAAPTRLADPTRLAATADLADPAGLAPFRRRDAARFGLSERDVRRLLTAGELHAVRRGILVGRRRVELAVGDARAQHWIRAAACLEALGGRVAISHESAARLHSLTRLGADPEGVRLTRAAGSARRMSGALVRVCGLPDVHVSWVDGLAVTTVARTVVDLARELPRRSAVVVADSALRAGCRREDLRRVLVDCWDWRGINRAAAVVDFADGRADGALESVSRVVFDEQGLPAADLQVSVGSIDVAGTVDFYWRGRGVVGEADGLLKYTDEGVLRAEKVRQERLEDAGFEVVRWGWDDIWSRPVATADRIRRAFARAAARR